jgi:hypothetical protein
MKKLILISIIAVVSLCSFGQYEKDHLSIVSYRFPKLHIIMANQFMIDSSAKYSSPNYISFPYGERKFGVYDPYMVVLITSDKDPIKGRPDNSIDTSAAAASRMQLEDLQYTIIYDDGEKTNSTDWKDITQAPLLLTRLNNEMVIPTTTGKSILLNKGKYYKVLINALPANQTDELVIRNKYSHEEMIRFRFTGMGNPVKPYLAAWSHDSSANRTIEEFMEKEMAGKFYLLPSIDNFYKNWPEKYSGKIINQQFFKSSKLAMYFRKPGPEYRDSSLEYRLMSESNTDTSWIRTGHRLFISDLKPGHHYRLQVRYISYPDRLQEHTFYVESLWYQKPMGKIIIGIVILLLLLIATLIIYRRRIRRTKQKMEGLRLEMKGLHSQLNPHFVFNALSSIQGLINKNDIVNANLYLTDFSTLLRESLKNNEKEAIALSEEFRLLNTYLRLEQVRFRFQYTLSVDPSVNTDAIEIPPLLFQPIVENAVKHGAGPLHEDGRIEISCKPDGNNLLISITDNGAGFTPVPAENGFGIKLTTQRISLLNKTLRNQSIELEFGPSKTSGTTVHLIFKNWL